MKLEKLVLLTGMFLLLPYSLSGQWTRSIQIGSDSTDKKEKAIDTTGVSRIILSTISREELRIPGLRSSMLKLYELISFGEEVIGQSYSEDTLKRFDYDSSQKLKLQYNPGQGGTYTGMAKNRSLRESGLVNPLLTKYELIDTGQPLSEKEEAVTKKFTVSIARDLLGERKTMYISGDGLDHLSVGLELTDITGNIVQFDRSDVSFDEETGLLRLNLLIEQGYYEFRIPTAEGTIKESLYISW